jgi:hypothetical protein
MYGSCRGMSPLSSHLRLHDLQNTSFVPDKNHSLNETVVWKFVCFVALVDFSPDELHTDSNLEPWRRGPRFSLQNNTVERLPQQ